MIRNTARLRNSLSFITCLGTFIKLMNHTKFQKKIFIALQINVVCIILCILHHLFLFFFFPFRYDHFSLKVRVSMLSDFFACDNVSYMRSSETINVKVHRIFLLYISLSPSTSLSLLLSCARTCAQEDV